MVIQRQVTRWIEERKDKEGNLLCLVPTCDNRRHKYKTSSRCRNYCKEHNYGDMQSFTSWNMLRAKILERDDYTCLKCRHDNIESYNLIADHIIPIALGGDEWDMANIQTLCLECNKIKTKQDHKDIAKLRRIENKLVNGQKQLDELE